MTKTCKISNRQPHVYPTIHVNYCIGNMYDNRVVYLFIAISIISFSSKTNILLDLVTIVLLPRFQGYRNLCNPGIYCRLGYLLITSQGYYVIFTP